MAETTYKKEWTGVDVGETLFAGEFCIAMADLCGRQASTAEESELNVPWLSG